MHSPSDLSKASPRASRRQQRNVARAVSIADLRLLSRKRLPQAIFDFYEGGAESESTLRANASAFDRYVIRPRYLVNVEHIDTHSSIVGSDCRLPIALSPTGGIGFGWPLGDTAIARAAGAFGIPYTLPTSATSSIERIAASAPETRRWFQAYMLRKREFTFHLIDRALAAGFEALVFTVDMPTGGKRRRDLKNDFGLPFRFTPRNLIDFARKPGWALGVLRHGMPQLENLFGFTPDAVSSTSIASSVGKSYDAGLDWDVLRQVRERWPRKLLIKGILHPEDAVLAADHGCDGVIVSNHGGRQLDCAIASLDALPAIAQAVNGRISVLLDGGVRTGVDVIKAIALGADAVMVGRPMLYGVCSGGEVGARRAIELLQDEMLRAMRLCGVRTVGEIRQRLTLVRNDMLQGQ